ncbi:hypothetical protein CH300_12600 [Rhodococcus sp. 15-1154-1]|nr:hypothetical protein [Rhodococcus sp. 15-1154-1]OZF06053.1 hypothetical protein CH300_12600 [Rhodococcus sp. 15-1154-1]
MIERRSPQPTTAAAAAVAAASTSMPRGSAASPTVVLLDTPALRAVLDVLGAVSMFAVVSAAVGARDAALTTAATAVLVLVSRALRHRSSVAARHSET